MLNAAGECVGVAFQSLKDGDSEGVGYVIPTPVVAHFLADVERNGVHTGFPTAGFEWQELESSALRAFLGLKKGAKGVLVTRVEPTSPCSSFLRRGDVVTAFDGVALSSDGTVPFRTGERISFAHLIAQRFVGDTARLDIIRDGQPMGGDVVLGVPTLLVPLRSATPPSYLILGGLVLVPATEDYLRAEFGEDYEFASPLPLLQCMFRESARTIIVFLHASALLIPFFVSSRSGAHPPRPGGGALPDTGARGERRLCGCLLRDAGGHLIQRRPRLLPRGAGAGGGCVRRRFLAFRAGGRRSLRSPRGRGEGRRARHPRHPRRARAGIRGHTVVLGAQQRGGVTRAPAVEKG